MSNIFSIPEDFFDHFGQGITVSGRKFPSDEDPMTNGLGWRLEGHSEAFSSLFCSHSPGSDQKTISLLTNALGAVQTWESVGDMPSGGDRGTAVALGSAYGLLCIDQFVKILDAGGSMRECVIAWDRICDTYCETMGQSLWHHVETGDFERKRLAREGGLARSEKFYGSAQQFVRDCWINWKENPDRYKSLSEFSRDMMDKLPGVAVNPITFDRWVRRWRLEEDEGA